MKRVLKWAGYGLAGVVVFALCVVAGGLAASEAMLRWPAEAPPVRLISAQSPSAARGARIARLNGCHDCHGADLRGQLFHEDEMMRAWGPNLTLAAARQSDAELEAAIRHGVGADGRALWVMPSYAFSQLGDQEVADLIAYVRSFSPGGEVQPRLQVSPMLRVGVLMGKFQSEATLVRTRGPIILPDVGPGHAQGRRLARLCVECHGADLKGMELLKSPDLTVAAAYDREAFGKLLHEGLAAGDRKLDGLMGLVAKSRFSALSDSEVTALHEYLKARAEREIAAAQ